MREDVDGLVHLFGMTAFSKLHEFGVWTYCSCGWIADQPSYGRSKPTTTSFAWRRHLQEMEKK